MKKKNILVIGLGPVGGIFAGYLAADGHNVYGIDKWEEHVLEIRRNGLKIEYFTTLHTPLQKVSAGMAELHGVHLDYVAIAVKTPYMPGVAAMLKDLPGEFEVVLLQNGLDNEHYAAKLLDKKKVLRMVVNYAGNMVSPGTIKMTFFNEANKVGCICGRKNCACPGELAEIMSAAGLTTEVTADIKAFTWAKTILNASIAPVTALLGRTMADVMGYPGTRAMVEATLHEAIAVATADGYDYGELFFDHCVSYLLKAGPHKPSMCIDLENGNPTEIDYINGRIVYYGKKHKIPVPYNTILTELMKAREHFDSTGVS
ncbi:MAG: 2-dehydropantoate 2-reductase [Candidatus Aminicenantes bacterium]|nr:2-dehydropantoate 2-reductase [Candidatus Aminicenantes bacterium]